MIRIAFLSLAVTAILAAEEKPQPAVEIRWAEEKAVAGLTQEKGVDLSCTDKKAYLHSTPVLTRADVAGCTAQPAGGGGILGGLAPYLVTLQLTKDAAAKMAKSSAVNKGKSLVLQVDGKIVAAVVPMADLSDRVPFLPSFTPEGLKAFTDRFGRK